MSDDSQEIFKNDTIRIICTDRTRRYFGNFHVVSLEIICEMAILPSHFEKESIYEEMKSLVGETIAIKRPVQQMGVPSERVDEVKRELIENFKKNAIPYLLAPSFAAKAVLAEAAKSGKSKALRTNYLKS